MLPGVGRPRERSYPRFLVEAHTSADAAAPCRTHATWLSVRPGGPRVTRGRSRPAATDGATINGNQVPIVGFSAASAGEHVVAFEAGYANTAGASWTADAPFTQRYPQTDGAALITTGVTDRPVTDAGAIPNGVAHLSRSIQLAEVSILLRPAVTAYQYDSRGNRAGVAPPGAAPATTYGYDQANRLTSVTTGAATVATYGYRGDGLRVSRTVGAVTTGFAWDESGGLPLLLAETTGVAQTNYVYGPGGRVIEQIESRPAITQVGSGHTANLGTTSNDVTATFPAAQPGDQILVAATTRNTAGINTPAGYTWVNGALVSGARTHLYRRTATGGEASVTVTFPTSAGVARIVQVVVYRNVDPANPIEGTTLGTAEGISTGAENVYVPSITTTDTADRLVFVGGSVGANPTAGTWTPPAGMTTHLTDTLAPDYGQIIADTALAEPGPTGTLRASYSAPNTNLVGIAVALRPAPTPVLFHHADQLGSTRALTDNNGAVVATYTYDPYGRLAASTIAAGRTITNPFGFAGEYTDAETGFQYLRARYYDPTTGQFLTRDPLSAITREAYGYAANNPANFTDPTGHNKCEVGANPLRWAGNAMDCASKVDPGEAVDWVQDISAAVQLGADLVAAGSAAAGLEPVAGVALVVASGAGYTNSAATCAEWLLFTGSSFGDCATTAVINAATAGFGGVVAPGSRYARGTVFTAAERGIQAGVNLFGDLLDWALDQDRGGGAEPCLEPPVVPIIGPTPR